MSSAGTIDRDRVGNAGALEHRLDLRPRGPRDDRDGHLRGRVPHRRAHLLRARSSRWPPQRDSVGCAPRSPRRRLDGSPPSHVRTISGSESPASSSKYSWAESGSSVLGEELHEDLAEDRLVLGERAVEIEDDGAGSHGHERLPPCPPTPSAFALAAAVLHAFWNLSSRGRKIPRRRPPSPSLVALVAYAPVAMITWRRRAEVSLPDRDAVPPARLRAPARRRLRTRRALARLSDRARDGARARPPRGSGRSRYRHVGAPGGGGLPRGRRRPARPRPPASRRPGGCRLGLAIAGFIAGYTLVDKYGIRYAAPFVYLELSMLLSGLAYTGALLRLRGARSIRAELNGGRSRPASPRSARTGSCWPPSSALPPPRWPPSGRRASSLRPHSPPLVLHEPVGPARFMGAVLVAGGVALVSL